MQSVPYLVSRISKQYILCRHIGFLLLAERVKALVRVSLSPAEEIWCQAGSFVLCPAAPLSSTARERGSDGCWKELEPARLFLPSEEEVSHGSW